MSVTSESSEWREIINYFKRTKLTPLKIVKIHNRYQWHNYQQTLHRFVFREENPNERILFHGTGDEDPQTIISSRDGIDFRFSNQGLWGFATYLAEDVRLSNSYAYEVPNTNLKSIFLVKALLGNVVHLKDDQLLILPPLIPTEMESSVSTRYDSVSGTHPSGHLTYMLYCNHHVYPEYLITYLDTN